MAAASDPVAAYRQGAGYGRVMRTSLAAGLLLLCASLMAEGVSGTPQPALSFAGLLAVLSFVAVGVIKHYRGLYRVRRHAPDSWRSDSAFLRGMLLAPFGVGDPAATRYDRSVRRVTVGAGMALLALLIVVRGAGRR